MLTVKHIEDSGLQSIQQAANVCLDGGKFIAYGCSSKGGAVDSDGVCQYASGHVYVMNASGATVASYNLG